MLVWSWCAGHIQFMRNQIWSSRSHRWSNEYRILTGFHNHEHLFQMNMDDLCTSESIMVPMSPEKKILILIYKNFHLSPFLSIQHLLGVPPYIFHDLWYLRSLRLHLESTPWGPNHSCPENTSLSAKVSKILPRGTTTGFQGRNQGITGRFLGKSKVEIYQNLPYGSHATLQSLIPSGRH